MMRLTYAGLAVLLASVVSFGAVETSSLIDAVKARDLQAVRALLREGAAVNGAEADGMTALHWAVRADDIEAVRMLVQARSNVNAANRYGVTPLTLAALNGSQAAAEALLQAGADPNIANPEGETSLMTAARTGNAAVVRLLCAYGADVNAKENWQGQTALMWAAAENNAAAVEALVEAGADMNIRSVVWNFPEYRYQTNGMAVFQLPTGGWTALMYAARQNAMEAAATLADMGADLNAVDPDGTTALHLAILNVHYDLAGLLLEKGADPDIPDSTGMTALYAAVDMRSPAGMMTRPNPKLAGKLDAAGVIKALLAHGADPDTRLQRPIIGRHNNMIGDTSLGEGTTPLARASKTRDLEIMRLLLEAGADPTITQKDRTTTAMIAAASAGNEASALEAVKLLVEHGVDVNAFNINGQTLLNNAASRGANSIINYIAGKGVRLHRQDKQGRTALDIALGAGGGRAQVDESTAALLRELMAR